MFTINPINQVETAGSIARDTQIPETAGSIALFTSSSDSSSSSSSSSGGFSAVA